MKNWTLHHGDCLEVLKSIPSGSVDAVVTDPPYGVGFKYASHKDNPSEYGEFIWSAISLAEKKCRPGSPVFVWQAAKHIRNFPEWFPRPWRIFVAAKNFAQVLPGPMWPSFEPVVVWWTGGADPWAEGCRRDFMVADTTPGGRKRRGEIVEGHPCPRPIEHLDYVVSRWVRPGGIVLDPFAGSGTTGVACLNTGRNFIGIEKDAGYYAIARKRLEDAEAKASELLPLVAAV